MSEYHPQLQLYTVAHNKLKSLERDFEATNMDESLSWHPYYAPCYELQQKPFDFIDDDSTIQADSALFGSFYELHQENGPIRIQFRLLRNGKPYIRESDSALLPYPLTSSHFSVELGPDMPPSIVNTDVSAIVFHNSTNIHQLVRNGVAEILGTRRSQSLIEQIDSFTIEQADMVNGYLKSSD